MKNKLQSWMKGTSRRMLCGMLVAAMAFGMTGCGEKEKEVEKAKVEAATTVSKGELKADSTVIAVGNTKVLYDEYRVYTWFLENQYESVLSEDVWNYSLGGTTVGQEAVEDTLRLMIQIKVMNKVAAEQGVSLGVDEKEDIDYKADQFLTTIPAEVQQANGITAELMHLIFEENEVARKMYDVVTGGVQANVDEASMQAAKVLMLHMPANDKNREEVRSQVNVMADELNKYNGNFTSFVKEKTGKKPEEVIIGRMDERKNLINTALTMQRYTTSGVIEEEDGFYIIYSLKINTSGLNKVYREQYITEQQNTAFQAAYENWAHKYEVRVSESLLKK